MLRERFDELKGCFYPLVEFLHRHLPVFVSICSCDFFLLFSEQVSALDEDLEGEESDEEDEESEDELESDRDYRHRSPSPRHHRYRSRSRSRSPYRR